MRSTIERIIVGMSACCLSMSTQSTLAVSQQDRDHYASFLIVPG
ncbi:MAG TPA: hypothetical protein VGC74_01545 [Stenotrophomonas sp.]|jgi:hypothetical protein